MNEADVAEENHHRQQLGVDGPVGSWNSRSPAPNPAPVDSEDRFLRQRALELSVSATYPNSGRNEVDIVRAAKMFYEFLKGEK